MQKRYISILAIWFLVNLYFFQAVISLTASLQQPWRTTIQVGYWALDIILAIVLWVAMQQRPGKNIGDKQIKNWGMGLVMLSFLPKLAGDLVLLVGDILRLGEHAVARVGHWGDPGALNTPIFQTAMISQVAFLVAAIPFVGVLHGIWKGKYQYKVHKLSLEFDNLPEKFDGFQITQLSDIHAGSFDNPAAVAEGIRVANKQGSDIIVFTGDMVNNVATEMLPWIETFSGLQAPMGKYSILGNHDYGDYVPWKDTEEKAANLQHLEQIHEQTGFRLLKNEYILLEKDGERIALAGVENWGKKGFAQYGDLRLATDGIPGDMFKVLLSHDPSHWEAEVLDHSQDVQLMLAGHTHGMQFGLEALGMRWSPAKYIYPQWAGIYEKGGKFLYVNRGFGFLGFPGRVGILPEITVITLKKKTVNN
ncbi:phosphohydrolase [Chitinophaga caeni]|uniref:Phosphohydrolase n=1 Tax=Chitinophaga caeni TaxID=2029983 RepID=A0A291QUY2_9BACT|nr:metallophosphoesterase [Chitinophaga caeni]ATL47745.1 phosphohydrolase [Chitinophaga caeni]